MTREYKVQQGKQDRLSRDKWFGLSTTLQDKCWVQCTNISKTVMWQPSDPRDAGNHNVYCISSLSVSL